MLVTIRKYLLCFLLLPPAMGCAQKNAVENIDGSTVASAPPTEQITAEKLKKVHEFIVIDGQKYVVPIPWRGNMVVDKPPAAAELKQIPPQFTYNGSKLYVESATREAFVEMATNALQEGVRLIAHSGFRSKRYQRKIFSNLMAKGRTWDDLVRYVAPPGYSEHILGKSIDLYPSNWQFAETDAYRWLKENGADFGFRETYPEHNSKGYPWEAWHWSYILEELDHVSKKNVGAQKNKK